MSKLRANVDNLQLAEEKLAAVYPGLNQLRGELQEVLSEVETSWEGQAAETYKAYLRKYLEMINSIQPSIQDLKNYSDMHGNMMSFLDKMLDFINMFNFVD